MKSHTVLLEPYQEFSDFHIHTSTHHLPPRSPSAHPLALRTVWRIKTSGFGLLIEASRLNPDPCCRHFVCVYVEEEEEEEEGVCVNGFTFNKT